MDIKDSRLQDYIKSLAELEVGGLSQELRPVFELMDAYDFFLIREGEESTRVQEILQLLLCQEHRPALRLWYLQGGDNINPTAMDFRNRLSLMAGERFGVFHGPI